MTYDDIRKDIVALTRVLLGLKKDISSGQVRNYPNVLNVLIRLGKTIRSLEKILDKQDDKTIRRRCEYIKNSAKEIHDIVSVSIYKPDSYIKVTGRLESFINELNDLSELLAETSQSQSEAEEKDGQSKTNIPDYKALNLAEVPISKLIQKSESHTLEFKEIPECNTQQNRKNNDVLFPPLKTIAGFLNAEGGILLIGVDNSGKIVGIEPYLNTMAQGNNDTFEQQIRNCLRERFEPYPIGKVKVSFEKFMEGTVCRIDVQADKEPVNLDNEVYVRDGNTTQLLKGRRLTDWIQQRRLLTVLPSGK